MKWWRYRRLFFAGWMWVLAGFAVAEPVDPRFPSERIEPPAEEWTWWLPTRIQQLEAERDQLLKKISVLPQHNPKFQSDHLGYHSLFEDPCPDGSLPPHQIDIKLSWAPMFNSIAFAPAFNPTKSKGGAYAFPKRFKIEMLNAETSEFETVVDWMDDDFPDPGPYPVFFSGINRATKQVRITVPQGVRESGVAYFALGEIYLFRPGADGRIGANVVAWATTEIEVSDSFAMPPIWDTPYLRDGVGGFGFPLSDETVASEDLLIRSENGVQLPDKVQLTLDLGRVRNIGPIDFWPAAAPHLLALSAFGFPEKISVELSTDPDFKKAKVFGGGNASENMFRSGLFSVKCKGYKARYVRIIIEGLREYKGERILGLGEISVSNNKEVWSVGCKVTAQGIPDEYLDQLPRLVDGCSRHRRILHQGEWIKGLAQRRPLDRRLAVVERELEMARATWRRIQLRSSVWGGGIVAVALIGGLVLQRRQRYVHAKRLREQIGSDLHDDIGSKVAAIALASTYVEQHAAEPSVRGRGARIQAIANAMHHGLRNVLWLTDTRTDTLDQLVRKLADCARVGIAAERLSLKTTPIRSISAKQVNVQTKRDLLLFFEEALHNAASHSNATRISVEVLVQGRKLSLMVQDDGTGFELPAEGGNLDSPNHHGLRTMHERSRRLHGQLSIHSAPDCGTTVDLCVSL